MAVEDGSGGGGLDDLQVDEGFGGGFALACNDLAGAVDFDEVGGGYEALVYAAGGHEEGEGFSAEDGAKVAPGAGGPAFVVDVLNDPGEGFPQVRGIKHNFLAQNKE